MALLDVKRAFTNLPNPGLVSTSDDFSIAYNASAGSADMAILFPPSPLYRLRALNVYVSAIPGAGTPIFTLEHVKLSDGSYVTTGFNIASPTLVAGTVYMMRPTAGKSCTYKVIPGSAGTALAYTDTNTKISPVAGTKGVFSIDASIDTTKVGAKAGVSGVVPALVFTGGTTSGSYVGKIWAFWDVITNDSFATGSF